MSKKAVYAVLCTSSVMLAATNVLSEENSGTALTIYSSAQPGSIAPETYRDGGVGQNVPGLLDIAGKVTGLTITDPRGFWNLAKKRPKK